MKSVMSSQRLRDDESDLVMEAVREDLMMTLKREGPMPVEELVGQLPHLGWVDVLKAISGLWGEGNLELEQESGRLKVWFVEKFEPTRYIDDKLSRKSHNDLELTVS